MHFINRIAAVLALVAALVVPAFAQDLTPEQRSGLEARIASFDAAMKANDMNTVMGTVPPKVMDQIATQFNVSKEDLIAAAQQQLNEAMKTVKLESFGMDLATAEFATLADGTHYALIPTETVMDLGAAGGKMRATSSTLGLLDGDTWYLVRVDDPQQIGILKQVYPGFADVTFPAGTMEPITQ